MDIRLTRKQLQKTLREMGVNYPADANDDELKEILERENSRLWLERAQHATEEGRRVIRKRRPMPVSAVEPLGENPMADQRQAVPEPVHRRSESKSRPIERSMPEWSEPVGDDSSPEPAASAHQPTFDPVRDVDTLVLRRAAGVCELCEISVAVDRNETSAGLQPYFFGSPQADADKTLKNVAALCPDCVARVRVGLDTAEGKKLRRMARRKVISKVAVSTRPKTLRYRRRKK